MAEFLEQFELIVQGKEHLPAYLLGDQQITLGEVNALANQIARWLSDSLPDDKLVVGICTEASLVTGALLFGILKAGKVFLGLDPAYPPERLRYMVEQSDCSLVLTDKVGLPGEFGRAEALSIQELMSSISELSCANPPQIKDDERPAYVTFTSGSTGLPKAVLAPVRQVDNRFVWMWEAYPFDQGEVCCHRMPLSFVDSLWEIIGPVCKATPVALISGKTFPSGMLLVDKLARHRVSRIWMLPAAINALVELIPNLGEWLPQLRFWVCTGDVLSPALVAKLHRAVPDGRLFNLYGTSEVWDATWYEVPTADISGLLIPIGRAIKNVDVIVVDASIGVLPKGAIGEIAVSGSGMALGYMTGSSRETKTFLSQVPGYEGKYFYLTGDIGRFMEKEEILFLGRRESIVNRAGHSISLVEVESALTLHPSVMEGAVASCKSDSGEVIVTGYYCVTEDQELQDYDLLAFLRGYLPDAALPDRLVRLQEFPMTPSGKIERRRLLESESAALQRSPTR